MVICCLVLLVYYSSYFILEFWTWTLVFDLSLTDGTLITNCNYQHERFLLGINITLIYWIHNTWLHTNSYKAFRDDGKLSDITCGWIRWKMGDPLKQIQTQFEIKFPRVLVFFWPLIFHYDFLRGETLRKFLLLSFAII